MHNIKTNFCRIYRICKEFFEGEVDNKGNFQFYPKATAMADLEIVALACTMEAIREGFKANRFFTCAK